MIEIIDSCLEKIKLKNRNVKILAYDVDALKQQLQPGNLIIKPQSFFCSYLIAYCLQMAEDKKVLPKLMDKEDHPIQGYTSFGTALYRGIWARIKTWQNLYQLDKEVKIQLNAKRTSPQVFRNFVVNNLDMFEEKFLISRIK